MQGDLTTLDRVRAWLAPDSGQIAASPAADAITSRLISASSRLVMNQMGRDSLDVTLRTETYPGGMTRELLLRQWPVLSVSALSVRGQSVGQAAAATAMTAAVQGYTLEAIRPGGGSQRLTLPYDRTFHGGADVTYTTGFVRTEQLLVPASGPFQVSVSSMWLSDRGVVDASGAPVAGYTVAAGLYTLPESAADSLVSVSYAYVPEDIEQVVIGNVALTQRSRDHIGQSSKVQGNNGGQTNFLPVALTAMDVAVLQNYTRVVPS